MKNAFFKCCKIEGGQLIENTFDWIQWIIWIKNLAFYHIFGTTPSLRFLNLFVSSLLKYQDFFPTKKKNLEFKG